MTASSIVTHGSTYAKVILLTVLVALAACGGGDVELTLGEAARDVGGEFCDRAIECFPDGAPSQSECVNAFVNAACENTNCSETVVLNADDYEVCLDSFNELTCNEVEAGVLPADCIAVEEVMQ